jgi:ParB family chromosome partitioning protein
MSKKKRFGISQSLQQGLSDTINAVKNNAGAVRFEVIGINRIETDPENPRELKISKEEIKNGLTTSSPFYKEKRQELESLQSLSQTIKTKGLINPVVVYKYGESYRLVAGERRFLASVLASREDIQARILNEKPKGLDLRLLQWIENTEREDLSLKDRIGNVKSILKEFSKENSKQEVTATVVKELIGVSLPQATCYLSILNAPKDVEEQIQIGAINNLDKAALLSKIKDPVLRQKAIQSCLEGNNLKSLRELIDQDHKKPMINMSAISHKKPGRAATRVNLGATSKPHIVKTIIFSVLKEPKFKHIEPAFKNTNWAEYQEASKAFQRFLNLLEKEEA